MHINLLDIIESNDSARVYNLTNTPLSGLEIYLISDTSNSYNKLLSSIPKIKVDDIVFDIYNKSPGESSINPIFYNRRIEICKVTVHNKQDEQLGIIVGSDLSSIKEDWSSGTNNRSLDDFIPVTLDLSSISNTTERKEIASQSTLVINPIFFKNDLVNGHYSNEVIIPIGGSPGYGNGAYGSGPYGGV